jgi:hypothetical protein
MTTQTEAIQGAIAALEAKDCQYDDCGREACRLVKQALTTLRSLPAQPAPDDCVASLCDSLREIKATAMRGIQPDKPIEWYLQSLQIVYNIAELTLRSLPAQAVENEGPFISGIGGKQIAKNVHEILIVCPAYGSDATYIYRLAQPAPDDDRRAALESMQPFDYHRDFHGRWVQNHYETIRACLMGE